MHVLAIGYSPAYLKENKDGIRQDWPRIPLPASREVLEASARLGHDVTVLLDIEGPVKGVTSGAIRLELRVIGPVEKIGGGRIDPGAGDLDLMAGWGHRGKGGVVMPAKGNIVRRDYEPEELEAIRRGASALGLSEDEAICLLGRTTYDVFLNGNVCWRNVPENVWGFYIGGYQVIKKWLNYRERGILGRGLTTDEVREVTGTARRIAAILLIGHTLNINHEMINSSSYKWP
jgi:Type ISP C-terminal specificity domain